MSAATSTASPSAVYDPAKEFDDYPYDQKTGLTKAIYRALWFCAGADWELLKKCPHSDHVTEAGVGGMVLGTAVLAFFSGQEAFSVILQGDGPSWVAAILGMVWALIIFNLDRFLVSSTGDGDGTHEITLTEFGKAFPRLLMAIGIGMVIAAPLEVRLMKKEVEFHLDEKVRDETKNSMAKIEAKHQESLKLEEENKKRISKELEDNRTLIEKYVAQEQQFVDYHRAQINGVGADAGDGPLAKANREGADKAKNERAIQEAKRAEISKQLLISDENIKRLNEARDAEEKLVEDRYRNSYGIATRINIAHEIFPKISMALFIFILLLEISPVLIKMMVEKGPYRCLKENQRRIVLAKYGIREKAAEMNTSGAAGTAGAGKSLGKEFHYEQAETVFREKAGRMVAERDLADAVREANKEVIEKDIQSRPAHYIVPPTQA